MIPSETQKMWVLKFRIRSINHFGLTWTPKRPNVLLGTKNNFGPLCMTICVKFTLGWNEHKNNLWPCVCLAAGWSDPTWTAECSWVSNAKKYMIWFGLVSKVIIGAHFYRINQNYQNISIIQVDLSFFLFDCERNSNYLADFWLYKSELCYTWPSLTIKPNT